MVTPLSSLPTLDTYIAFNPTAGSTALFACQGQALPASGSSNSYWTNVSSQGSNVLSFTCNSGRQHYLDRVEAGTLRMVVNNRNGFFTNGGSSPGNGTGYVLDPRCPIAVTLTWMGTTYPVFFGLTDQIAETIIDQVNSTLTIQASDFMKQLSLKYMSSTNFWPNYAQSTSAANWYRMDQTQTGTVTAASGNGTTVTYTAFNNLSVGQNVTITGLTPTGYNLQNVTVATASSSGFTVTNSYNPGVGSSGTGSAFRTAILDQIGSNNGNYIGPVSFPTYGAMIYDTDQCVDVGNGGKNANAYIRLPDFAGTQGAIDFWVLGSGMANAVFTIVQSTGAAQIFLACSQTGFAEAIVLTVGTVTSTVQINDGYWHHIGLVSNSSGILTLYVDGQFFGGGALAGLTGWTSVTGQNTVIPASIGAAAPSMYVDEIIISTNSHLAGLENEVTSRYRAGVMLQLPTNPSQPGVPSGDRIAEILTVAGFGVITAGAIVLNSNLYFINNGSAWAQGTAGNGYINSNAFYWDTPVTTSTALDLIGEITDTDIGSFFQKPDGTFNYFNQSFYGSWGVITALSSTSSTLTVTMANSLSPGNTVTIFGCTPSGYNGTWTVATASSSSFTITSTVNPGTGTAFGHAYGAVGCWVPNTYSPSGDHVWSDDATSIYNYFGPNTQVIRDDADTWTMVEITPQAGTMQTYENVAAEARYGYAVLTKSSTLHPSLAAASSTAYFLGYIFRSPLPRVQSVELRTINDNGGNNTALFGTKLGDVVNFIRTMPNASTSGTYPAQRGGINTNMIVEAIQIDFDSERGSYQTVFTLDPYPIRA